MLKSTVEQRGTCTKYNNKMLNTYDLGISIHARTVTRQNPTPLIHGQSSIPFWELDRVVALWYGGFNQDETGL